MRPVTHSPSHPVRTLRDVLLDTHRLVEKSEPSDWILTSPEEIASDLLRAVAAIDEKKPFAAAALSLHFAPTGSLQETAIWNRWTDDYMRLSSEFDELIKRL